MVRQRLRQQLTQVLGYVGHCVSIRTVQQQLHLRTSKMEIYESLHTRNSVAVAVAPHQRGFISVVLKSIFLTLLKTFK